MNTKEKSIFDQRYRDFIVSVVNQRKSVGITQRELAHKLGTSNCYVARIETHERRLDMIEAIDLMRALDMSEQQIINEIRKLL